MKLMCLVFGRPMEVTEVIDYSPDDYYTGRDVTVSVGNGQMVTTVPISSLSIVSGCEHVNVKPIRGHDGTICTDCGETF